MKMEMLERKVHEVKGSFLVYLPKEWIKSRRVEERRKVYLIELENGDLLIKPMIEEEKAPSLEIDVDKYGWEKALNLLLAGYIVGADKIILASKHPIPIKWRQETDLIVKKLLGLEVVEEKEKSIVVKEITQLYDLNSMIERMISTTKYMLKHLSETIESGGGDIEILIGRDEDVDRYRYAVERQLHKLIREPTLAIEAEMNSNRILHYLELVRYVERIADHIVSTAEIISRETEEKGKAKMLKPVLSKIFEIYDKATQVLKSKSLEEAYKIIHLRENVRKNLKEIEGRISPKLRTLTIHLTRIADYTSDISEIMINTIVAEKLCA